MEQLLRCTQPAVIVAADHLIDLVDRVIARHQEKHEVAAQFSRRPQFACVAAFLGRKNHARPAPGTA
jgi:hypothetical protein